MRKTLIVAVVCLLSLVVAPVTAFACSGPCMEASFPCCCNGQFIGCYTSVMGCYNGCQPSIEETSNQLSSFLFQLEGDGDTGCNQAPTHQSIPDLPLELLLQPTAVL